MEKISQGIQTKSRQSQLYNYSKSIKNINQSKKNISNSFINDRDKSFEQNNSLLNLEPKRRINPIKFNFNLRTELRKPELKKFYYQNNIFNKINSSINSNISKSIIEQPKRNTSILQLSANFEEFKNNSISSPKMRIPQNIKIKNSIFRINNNIKSDLINKKIAKRLRSGLSFHDLGSKFLEQNKYLSDFVMNNINEDENKMLEKKDWETVENEKKDISKEEEMNMEYKDLKIELLAKDLNLFQNKAHFKKINIKKNNSYNNLLNKVNLSEESISFVNGINKVNNINENLSPASRLSTRTPSSRIYSGKIINNYNNININKFNFDKNKIHNILEKRKSSFSLPEEYEYNIEGTNILSPFCQKARDLFLYRKIFFYFGHKKLPKIMTRFLNNKLNLLYAENEKQFEEKMIRENSLKRITGKGKILKVGKADTEKRAESINHKVGFIKKVFDYAYPDILIYRIRKKSNMEKIKIRKLNLKNLLEKKEIDDKTKINRLLLKKNGLLNSIKISKV